jgi:hypothetical protein
MTHGHHPTYEPLLIGGDGGADDKQQHQPMMNGRDSLRMMNSEEDKQTGWMTCKQWGQQQQQWHDPTHYKCKMVEPCFFICSFSFSNLSLL